MCVLCDSQIILACWQHSAKWCPHALRNRNIDIPDWEMYGINNEKKKKNQRLQYFGIIRK